MSGSDVFYLGKGLLALLFKLKTKVMKSFLLLTFMITAFAGFCQQTCLVTKVIDGDTYKILRNGKLETLRLMNVDAPETGQYFGSNARDSVAALMQGHLVEVSLYEFDLYGRRLASIKVNGVNLDSLMIAKGWAFYYYKFSRNKRLAIYEADAKLHFAGIWKCMNNVPPWIWRRLNKTNKRLYATCQPMPYPSQLVQNKK